MASSRKRKEELVADYVDMLQRAKGVVVTEYRGMTMKHLDELRGKLREKNAGFTVTKNTLLKVALREVGMAVPDDLLVGPVALAVNQQRWWQAGPDMRHGGGVLIHVRNIFGQAAQ